MLLEKPMLESSVCLKFTFQGLQDYSDKNMHLKKSKIHSIVNHVLLNLKLRVTDTTHFKVILIYLFI